MPCIKEEMARVNVFQPRGTTIMSILPSLEPKVVVLARVAGRVDLENRDE